ncbi:MAG TPA: peroxiredoxin [Burkholderiales bacterium]|nr:peroxiredoxin [Burkholderiales bacterium]
MSKWWWVVLAVSAVGLLLAWRSAAQARAAPEVGASAPALALPDQAGKVRHIEDFRGKWLVLYFYPKDDTPGCTREACMFRDDWQKLDALGAQIAGVSVDNALSHAAFARKYHLPFPLLADAGGEVAARYGSLRDFGLFKFAQRNTFLIDPQGRVMRVYLGASTSKNSREIIEDLKKLTGM